MSGRYLLRTFGCQMNEHDSERIAGLLEADGLTAAGSVDEADVVVLNTCCIRENADNKLYGHLGHLKAEKARRPDLQIVVGKFLSAFVFLAGIIFLLFKQIWHHYQLWFLPVAVGLIIVAHIINYRSCRVHNHAHSEDCNH